MASAGLTREKTELIIDQYEELAGKLESFELMPQGLFNENAQLKAAGQIYVLKKMTVGRTVDRHRYGAQIQNILANDGFPCPRVLCTRDGREISSFDGDLWSVQTWADGRYCSVEMRDGPEALQLRTEIGTALGQLHANCREALRLGNLPPAPEEARLSISRKISRIESEYRNLFGGSLRKISTSTRLRFKLRRSSAEKEALVLMPVLKEGCRQLLNWDFSQHSSLEVLGPCHGDINWENLFFQDFKLAAVLDFDNAMEMNQTFDAAAAAAVICADNTEHLEAFLIAYEQAGGAPVEREIFPDLMLLKYVRSLLFQMGLLLSGGTGNHELAKSWREFLAKNIDRLTASKTR